MSVSVCEGAIWCLLVLVQLTKLAEVREVVPDGFELVPGNMAVAVRVEVLEN